MNLNRFRKAVVLFFVVVSMVGFLTKDVTAQVINQQIMLQSPMSVPIPGYSYKSTGWADLTEIEAILVDNFEYWSNPRNMGWTPIEPAYPMWGAGLGYGQIQTILDFEEGSRVFDVYRPTSAFLLDPMTGLTTYMVTKSAMWMAYEASNDAQPIWGDFCEFTCKIRHPLSIEDWDTFSIIISVRVKNNDTFASGIPVSIVLRPIEFSNRHKTLADSVEEQTIDDPEENYTIEVALGRQFQDGSWHYVRVNLDDIVKAADENCTLIDTETEAHDPLNYSDAPGEKTSINGVAIAGNQYRLDDIMFTQISASVANNRVPHLFKIGPIYGQMWNMAQTFWIMAEDPDLGMTMFVNDDGDYEFTNIVGNNPAEKATFDLSSDGGSLEDLDITLDTLMETVKIQSDDPGDSDGQITDKDANLNFLFTVGDSLGASNFLMARPLSCVPEGENDESEEGTWPFSQGKTNNFPPYLLQKNGVIIPNLPDADNDDNAYLRSMSNPMYVLAVALYNSGHKVFPTIRAFTPSLGQVPENIIVTCRVTDGMATDTETFHVSVVNYPVTNYPPMLNDLDDQVFYVNETPDVEDGVNVYQVVGIDHDMQDMFNLTYDCTLNGLPNYQIGPYQQRIISPTSGLIAFTPYGEGALNCVITVSDPRGMYAIGEITIFCCNQGTWFNHPPVIIGDLDSPQTIKAGQLFVANEMDFVDPDGDALSWSCNIGAVGEDGIYTFQSQYPGYYSVQITAYDIRGGAATTEFVIHVLPWWAY